MNNDLNLIDNLLSRFFTYFLIVFTSLIIMFFISNCIYLFDVFAYPLEENIEEYNENFGIDDMEDDYIDDDIEETNFFDFDYKEYFEKILEKLEIIGGAYATPSDATPSNADIEKTFDEEQNIKVIPADEMENISFFAAPRSQDFVNVLRYNVRINSTDYTLLLPIQSNNSIWVDNDGFIYNVGTSTISGKLYTGDTFNPNVDNGLMLYLNPVLSNNYSSIRNNRSNNYMRRYYWERYNSYNNDYRLTYTDTYVHVKVLSNPYTFATTDTLTFILIILLGFIVSLYIFRGFTKY